LSEFTCLLGGSAFSEFQRQKLTQSLCARTGMDFQLKARFIYFVESGHQAGGDELEKLESLLQAQLATQFPDQGVLLVVPRLGTQSPWSSKATDIARRCGLLDVTRIERGTLFQLPVEAIQDQNINAVSALIHDRMTQTVLTTVAQASDLFDHQPPRPLVYTDIAEDAEQALSRANRELGLALSAAEIQYLINSYRQLTKFSMPVGRWMVRSSRFHFLQ